MCRGGVCTRIACEVINSLQTSIVPKTTCSPSKKLSPMIITWDPPAVQPSLGEIALMHGVATGRGGYKPGWGRSGKQNPEMCYLKCQLGWILILRHFVILFPLWNWYRIGGRHFIYSRRCSADALFFLFFFFFSCLVVIWCRIDGSDFPSPFLWRSLKWIERETKVFCSLQNWFFAILLGFGI